MGDYTPEGYDLAVETVRWVNQMTEEHLRNSRPSTVALLVCERAAGDREKIGDVALFIASHADEEHAHFRGKPPFHVLFLAQVSRELKDIDRVSTSPATWQWEAANDG